MVQVNILNYKLQDLQFFNKLDKPGQVQLESNFSFSVNFSNDNKSCMAKIYQCVKDKTDDPNHNFFLSVEMVGVFALEGVVDDESKKDIHVACYQQLFPYAELAARQTAALGGMPNFALLRQKMTRDSVVIQKKA